MLRVESERVARGGDDPMRRVVVLGGGMAGLAAAWRLSDPSRREEIEVTVYQRGWRLGGKGASSRGAHGRIEEHGLHVWFGYYDNAFALMREVYDELDRDRTDPACPIRSWRDAFTEADDVGVEDGAGGSWSHWVATFRRQPGEPGDDRETARPRPRWQASSNGGWRCCWTSPRHCRHSQLSERPRVWC